MIEHTANPLVFNAKINNTKYAKATENHAHCPFCETESLTNIIRTDDHKIWLKNKYSTIEESLMTVIIESDQHLGDVSIYSQAENRQVFKFAFECWDQLIASADYASVLMFKNFGPRSGGTLRHPHMQIVGLKNVDGYQNISPENFEGVKVKEARTSVSISTRPIMGFVEFNVAISDLKNVEALADDVQLITQYLLNDYLEGRCDSYNLFFHHFAGRYICKIVPRFITSPYFIGYKLSQVNQDEKLTEIAETLKTRLT
ncbi:MAG: DUF4931 domain-containing protein [Lactococcus sp.]